MNERNIIAPPTGLFVPRGTIIAEYFRRGVKFAEDRTSNVITLTGMTEALNATFGLVVGGANWYLAPLKAGTPAESWDPTDLGGTNEFTAYDEPTRLTWTPVVTDQTITNAADATRKITISTNDSEISGCALVNVSAKSNQTGLLFAAGNFTAARSGLQDGDEVYLTYQIDAANG